MMNFCVCVLPFKLECFHKQISKLPTVMSFSPLSAFEALVDSVENGLKEYVRIGFLFGNL